jgi:hypothetical protein
MWFAFSLTAKITIGRVMSHTEMSVPSGLADGRLSRNFFPCAAEFAKNAPDHQQSLYNDS